jgi:molybdopterin/thiamine biosynthesis adenylyltransferase
VDAAILEDGFALVYGQQTLRVLGPVSWARSAVARLQAGVPRDSVAADRHMSRLVDELRDLGWLREDDTDPAVPARLERQVGYLSLFGRNTNKMVHRLHSATVALLGVGGIGAMAAQHLAGAGVGRLVLIDHDVVQEHNLNRQFAFTLNDTGQPKVHVLQRVLSGMAPDTNVRVLLRAITTRDDLHDVGECEVLLLGADHPKRIDHIAWSWCAQNGAAYIRAAVGHERGYWGPLLDPEAGHCLACFEEARTMSLSDYERQLENTLHVPTKWSFGPTNTVLAAWAAHDIVQYLCGEEPACYNTRMVLDFQAAGISRKLAPAGRMLGCAHHENGSEV